jgi:transglutaminase-like putative cysteine protease
MPGKSALFLRSITLFAILWQFRLLAADLADTPVYAATLLCAFLGAFVLARLPRLKPPAVLPILFLAPWAARAFIALPGMFAPGIAITLDSLLLNLDRNSFVSLLPFYWAAFATYFSARSRRFLRADIIAADVLLLVVYSINHTSDLPAYRWPVLMIAVFSAIIFLQILAFMLSLAPEYALQKREGILGGAALLLLTLAGGALLIRPSQEEAVDKGGGLLEPNMFHFDFSQVVRLESEISMNDDLVFIVRKDPGDQHTYLRRYVLSGYNPKQGFYRHETIDEAAQPQRLPDSPIRLEAEPVENFRLADQEYYLVNFDSAALIALKEPVEITPFESWDASSFSSAYGVKSRTSEVLSMELADVDPGTLSGETLGLSAEDYAWYTDYGGNEGIARYARELAGEYASYWEKIQIIYETLKYGEYRYSLKPGIAPEGDQLGHFLFETKKGYCSYYAFAFALLLRSLGIPARIAAGFFIDPELDTFNYYPVRSDMAHAWVEVRYPRFGWVEYDPTTGNLAEGEEFAFSSGTPQDLFERLMREILENRSRLSPKTGREDNEPVSALAAWGRNVGSFFHRHWPPFTALLMAAVFAWIRGAFLARRVLTGDPRKKALLLWAHALRRLRLAGHRRRPREQGEAEWSRSLEGLFPGLYALCRGAAAARYAPDYAPEQGREMEDRYRSFGERYREQVSPGRRVLAWVFPPLALVLGAKKRRGSPGAAALLGAALLLSPGGDGVRAQTPETEAGSTELYAAALEAEQSEYWDRAIERYKQGMERYPQDSRFSWALGQLYESRRLYGLAWETFKKTEALTPYDPELLYRMALVAGHLNENALSVAYLERLLSISPDNLDAIGNLAWMYYKLHRLEDGERLLLDARGRFGPGADFAMTLGTIYSDMFRYDEAKAAYLEAIAGGEEWGDHAFSSVAHYNLSLLESRFYHFSEALEETDASLASQNRSSGWLARGELYLRRLDFSRTFAAYQEAYEYDNSPLSKINMAHAFQVAGRLEEARLYAEESLNSRDLSWMMNYGIDPDRYRRDLHQILWRAYSGLAKTGSLSPRSGPKDRLMGLVMAGYHRFKAAAHRHLFQKYSLLAANAYRTAMTGEPRLEALIQYYNAFETYPRRARVYLGLARDFEAPLIPQAANSYDAELGTLLKDRALLNAALDSLDPIWERDAIADSYAELALLAKGASRRAERQDAAERLYALNRGALRQNGIPLPASLNFVLQPDADGRFSPEAARLAKPLSRILGKAGIQETGIRASGPSPARLTLTLEITAGEPEDGWTIRCELRDEGRGTSAWQRTLPLPSPSARDLSAFARALADQAFTER